MKLIDLHGASSKSYTSRMRKYNFHPQIWNHTFILQVIWTHQEFQFVRQKDVPEWTEEEERGFQ